MIDPCTFRDFIIDDLRFIAVAGSRFYPLLLPQKTTLPAATYQVISERPLYSLEANVHVTQMRLQIDVWGESYAAVRNLASVVFAILDNFSGDLSDGTHIYGIQLRNQTDYFEHEVRIYRNLLEFEIQYA